jgi:sugar phosphate isomerase/epimerase
MWNWNFEKDESSFAACATPKSFLDHLSAVNDPFLVACLDIGHAEMRGVGTSAVEMIRALGHDHLGALHIHDNDQWHDSHQNPFTMSIDFNAIVAALREIDYTGDFTLEADAFIERGCSFDVAQARICEMAKTARRLADMYEAL